MLVEFWPMRKFVYYRIFLRIVYCRIFSLFTIVIPSKEIFVTRTYFARISFFSFVILTAGDMIIVNEMDWTSHQWLGLKSCFLDGLMMVKIMQNYANEIVIMPDYIYIYILYIYIALLLPQCSGTRHETIFDAQYPRTPRACMFIPLVRKRGSVSHMIP